MITGRIKQGYGVIQRDIMTIKELSIYSKAVYCLLVSYAGNKDQCFPSLKTMCSDLSISKTTLIKSLKELISFSLLTADKSKTKDGDFANNIYYPMYLMDTPEVVHQVNHTGSSSEPRVVHEVVTKNNTSKKEQLRTDTKVSEVELFPTQQIARSPSISERCKLFIEAFNKTRLIKGKPGQYKTNKSLCGQLRERLKVYTAAEILKALKNAMLDKYHIDNNFYYLTPEYILREKIIERYLNQVVEADQLELTGELAPNHNGPKL